MWPLIAGAATAAAGEALGAAAGRFKPMAPASIFTRSSERAGRCAPLGPSGRAWSGLGLGVGLGSGLGLGFGLSPGLALLPPSSLGLGLGLGFGSGLG